MHFTCMYILGHCLDNQQIRILPVRSFSKYLSQYLERLLEMTFRRDRFETKLGQMYGKPERGTCQLQTYRDIIC